MNPVRSSFSMHSMLLGDSFQLRPYNHMLGTAGSVRTNKWELALESENKIDQS